MPATELSASDLTAFSGVRGVLFDVDGVFHVSLQPIPGAVALLNEIAAQHVPFRLLTNTTTVSRATLAAQLRQLGLPVADDHLLTAPVATADYVRRRFPGVPCYLLAKGDVAADFQAAGIDVVGPGGTPAAGVVVIGGAEDELTYARLNHAYRLLLGGAKLVAMHRNVAWKTAQGMQLDSGPFIAALAGAAGVRTTVVGKPALPIFRHAVRAIGLPANQVAMVGDDARTDLQPARRLGLTGVLVRTGKPIGPGEEALADIVLDSVAGLRPLLVAAGLLAA
ncbi:MAG: HAD-IIA family hydrolase [Chloroflexota bacterium]|nr:HAD-IIA family hydrolase [Chloroflexota bacterium]